MTLSVWKALFLREATGRLFAGRLAWFWLFAEPMLHIACLVFIFTVVRVRSVGGVDTALWLIVGMLAFFVFKRTGTQVMNGIAANQALFSYRQVKAIDTLLVRAALEGLLMLLVAALLLAAAALLGHDVVPADPLAALAAFAGLWLLGVGFGLAAAVAVELLPETGGVMKLVMMPLYLISGVIVPIAGVPEPYRGWLTANPVAQGLELVRLGFAPHYSAFSGASFAYVIGWALAALFLGLALQRRYALRLVTR